MRQPSWQAKAISISARAVPGMRGGVLFLGSQTAGGVTRGAARRLDRG